MSIPREQVGTVGVDAGVVMVGDPCYTLPDDGSSRTEAARDWDRFVAELYPDRRGPANPTPLGEGVAVVVPSGHGDGVYPVYVERASDGAVARLIVEFIADDTDAAPPGPITPAGAQALREAADALDALGRGCAPEYAAWLRERAASLPEPAGSTYQDSPADPRDYLPAPPSTPALDYTPEPGLHYCEGCGIEGGELLDADGYCPVCAPDRAESLRRTRR